MNRFCLSPSTAQVPLVQNLFRRYGCRTPVTQIFGNCLQMSPTGNSVYGIRTFCSAGDFAAKKCVPCESKNLLGMREDTATSLMSQVPGWKLVKEDEKLKLSRPMKVKSFLKGLELFKRVGELAEEEGHHPDLHLVGWNNVTIEIWTHAVGGLTENDFILAAKINKLKLNDLQRITPGEGTQGL